jgi:hypothetical protein
MHLNKNDLNHRLFELKRAYLIFARQSGRYYRYSLTMAGRDAQKLLENIGNDPAAVRLIKTIQFLQEPRQ